MVVLIIQLQLSVYYFPVLRTNVFHINNKINTMKKIYLCLFILLNISFIMKSQSINKEKINSQEAIKLIQEHQADTNFIILDVRTPDEYKSGHIENSICINFESADFKENVSKLDKIKTYLVYCHGEGRSGAGIKIMKNMGFSNLILLLKGIEGWKENGFKTTTN